MSKFSSFLALSSLLAAFAIAASPAQAQAQNAPENPGQDSKPTVSRELLSEHDVLARFDGIKGLPCRFRTALCPDRCNHANRVAIFSVIKYLSYKKPGEYGDPQATTHYIPLQDNGQPDALDPTFRDVIKDLKPGDLVHLQWSHEYVSRKTGQFEAKSPERPTTGIQKLTPAEAEKLFGGKLPELPPLPDLNKNPGAQPMPLRARPAPMPMPAAPQADPAPLIEPR